MRYNPAVMVFSEAADLIYYQTEKPKFPVVIIKNRLEFETGGEKFGVEYHVVTPLPEYYCSENKEDNPRIIKIDDRSKAVRGMMHRARFGQVVQAILADCGTENGVTQLKFGLAAVNDHEWVLGAMFEAGWPEKQLIKAEDGLLIVPGLSFPQKFGMRSDHYLDKHVFYAFIDNAALKPAQVKELKARMRILVTVSKMILTKASGDSVGQEWLNNQIEYQLESGTGGMIDEIIWPA